MRLKRAEKEKYLSEVLQAQANRKNSKVVPLISSSTEYAWMRLCWEHFSDLRLKLARIGDYLLKDSLYSDAGLPHITVQEYFRHYDNEQLGMIYMQLKEARTALENLQALLYEEDLRRKNRKYLGIDPLKR